MRTPERGTTIVREKGLSDRRLAGWPAPLPKIVQIEMPLRELEMPGLLEFLATGGAEGELPVHKKS